MRQARGMRTMGWAALLAAALAAGCVTEEIRPKGSVVDVRKTMRAIKDPKQAIVADPKTQELVEVQNLVMVKALGGLRSLDTAALDESGWDAGLQEAQRINADPMHMMNRGLRHTLIDQKYRVRYCLEKKDAPTSATQSGGAPEAAKAADAQKGAGAAEKSGPKAQANANAQAQQGAQAGQKDSKDSQNAKDSNAAGAAAPAQGSFGVQQQGKTWLLVTVPARGVGFPLAQTQPYAFVVRKMGSRYRIIMSDWVPPELMGDLNDDQVLQEILKQI